MFGEFKKVILCKGQSENNESQKQYVDILESAGYVCENLQTLKFEFVNLQELKRVLLDAKSYSGLILTSKRAVEAIDRALDNENIQQNWGNKQTFCVGPATETLANNLGLRNCLGSQSGNAKELCKVIQNCCEDKDETLLFPCSEIVSDTIEKTLTDYKINLHKLVVYRTLVNDTLEQDFLQIVQRNSAIFVFFSPSTVKHIAAIIDKNPSLKKNIVAVAIGPVTEKALTEANFKVHATAIKPEPVSLMQSIQSILFE